MPRSIGSAMAEVEAKPRVIAKIIARIFITVSKILECECDFSPMSAPSLAPGTRNKCVIVHKMFANISSSFNLLIAQLNTVPHSLDWSQEGELQGEIGSKW